jgi:hypothetical protein
MNKFAEQLSRSTKSLSKDRAERWANGAKRAQRGIIDKLEAKIDNIQEELDNHNDLSTLVHASNPGRSKGEFQSESHMEKIQELEVSLIEEGVRLKVAKKTYDKWFADSKDVGKDD